jgi:ferredoxin
MRITIDWNLCIGSGLCAAAAPAGMRLVPVGNERRAILCGCADEADLLAAARACPTLAIRLYDAAGQELYPPAPRRPG